jgi:hypothetical protein
LLHKNVSNKKRFIPPKFPHRSEGLRTLWEGTGES